MTAARLAAALARRWHRRRFAQAARPVLACAPLRRGNEPLTVLSMVQPADTLAYLLALRSFARYINPQRVVVVCDPSMTPADTQRLRQAVPHIELRRAEEFRHRALPVGGTWERLAAITEYAARGYVLQLDADTVTRGPLEEVRQALAAGQGFVLGERAGQGLVTLEEAHADAAAWQRPGLHVQGVAEFVMAQAGLAGTHYVRGCSGFTGFARTAGLQARLIDFSQRMQGLLGPRWNEWGTEQVASNYLVANLSGTRVLPFPAYGTPDQFAHQPRFLHFICSMR
jgi:hypothetical protein